MTGRNVQRYRITPAYAGKRVQRFWRVAYGKDHPRLCGEKLTAPEIKRGGTGSPPPMRGKVVDVPVRTIENRITPAYAGKS